jgi:hypothetical protein
VSVLKRHELTKTDKNVFLFLRYLYSYTECDNVVVHDVCVFPSACVRETLLLLAIALTHLPCWCFGAFGIRDGVLGLGYVRAAEIRNIFSVRYIISCPSCDCDLWPL